MSNINKIIIAVVSCVFMICVASVSIVSIVMSDKTETTAVPTSQQTEEAITTTPSVQSQIQNTSAPTTAQPPPQAGVSTTTPSTVPPETTSAAETGSLETDILGKWTDSAGMSGYEFLEGGKVNMTYVDLAGFGVPFDGKASGLYTLEGDTLTVKFSIYTATIKKAYRISIKENELSMYDLEDFEASTYARVAQ